MRRLASSHTAVPPTRLVLGLAVVASSDVEQAVRPVIPVTASAARSAAIHRVVRMWTPRKSIVPVLASLTLP